MKTRRGPTVTLNAAGLLTNNGAGQTYTYNNHARYTQLKLSGTKKADYYYDFQGLRTRKVLWSGSSSTTTVYHYDLSGRLIMETSNTAAVQATYLYDDAGAPLAMIQAPNGPYNSTAQERIVYLHADQLGTPRWGTDAAQRVVWRWESDGFGSSLAQTDPDGDGTAITVNLRFPGQYYDAESALHYNWNRDYDPTIGRYIQADPIGLAGGLNTYGYVGGNPLKYFDPYGLTQCDIDVCADVVRDTQPDLVVPSNEKIIPGGVPIHPETGKPGSGWTDRLKDRVHINERFLEPLGKKGAIELLKTIIHESVHYTLPRFDPRQIDMDGRGFPYDEENRRTTNELINRFNKERKKKCSVQK